MPSPVLGGGVAPRRRGTAQAQQIVLGPFGGVNDSAEYGEERPTILQDLLNGYIPDPARGSDVMMRPPFATKLTGVVAGNAKARGFLAHRASDGVIRRFGVVGQRLVRYTSGAGNLFNTYTDVTPAGVTIVGSDTLLGHVPFVALVQFGDGFVLNDQWNPPYWVSNLDGSPVTMARIAYYSPQVLLARGSTDTRLATLAIPFQINNAIGVQAAIPVGTVITGAGNTPANTWAIYRVVTDGGTISLTAGAANATTGYASEAAAIAAVPAVPSHFTNYWDVGYVTIQTGVGVVWRPGTDALAGGVSGNPALVTHYYAGDAPPWAMWGEPTIYSAKALGIVRWSTETGAVVYAQNRIAWSEENDATLGYRQIVNGTSYTNDWNLTQTSQEPLYAVKGTNNGLYYWREWTIGRVTGEINADFQTTATHDAIYAMVGTRFAETVRMFGDAIFFADALGRPQRMQLGGLPVPVWEQMRESWNAGIATGGGGGVDLSKTACAAVSPDLGLVVFALWSPDGSSDSVQTLYAFDGLTGKWMGRWTLLTAAWIDCLGTMDGVFVAGGSTTDLGTGRGSVFVQTSVALTKGSENAMSLTTPTLARAFSTESRLQRVVVDGGYQGAVTTGTAQVTYLGALSAGTPKSLGTAVMAFSADLPAYSHWRTDYGCSQIGRWHRLTVLPVASGTAPVSIAGIACQVVLGSSAARTT